MIHGILRPLNKKKKIVFFCLSNTTFLGDETEIDFFLKNKE